MSKKSLACSIVAIAAVFVVASALTFSPEAWGGPRDGERSIQPGGWPSKIRSYYGSGTIIPSVEGPNGYIITGLYFSTTSNDSKILSVDTGSGPQVIGEFHVTALQYFPGSQQVLLDPGIPVQVGAVVSVNTSAGNVTITGYTY